MLTLILEVQGFLSKLMKEEFKGIFSLFLPFYSRLNIVDVLLQYEIQFQSWIADLLSQRADFFTRLCSVETLIGISLQHGIPPPDGDL